MKRIALLILLGMGIGCKTQTEQGGNHIIVAPVGSRYVLEYVDGAGIVRRKK